MKTPPSYHYNSYYLIRFKIGIKWKWDITLFTSFLRETFKEFFINKRKKRENLRA